MLGKFQALGLVVGAQAAAIEAFRFLQHMLVNQAADDLAVFQDEGHFVAAHFQHRAAACAAGLRVAEAGIEEAGIVDAELAYQGVKGCHFGRIKRGHMHGLA